MWGEEVSPLSLSPPSSSGAPSGGLLSAARVPVETEQLISFMKTRALLEGEGGPQGGPYEGKQSCKYTPATRMSPPPLHYPISLPQLRCLLCPSCLLPELCSNSKDLLPSLKHLDTWGDSSRIKAFLKQKRQLKTVRVRGISSSSISSCSSADELLACSRDTLLDSSGSSGNLLTTSNSSSSSSSRNRNSSSCSSLRGGPYKPQGISWHSSSSAFSVEAETLEQFEGPGCILRSWSLCPRLLRLEVRTTQLSPSLSLSSGVSTPLYLLSLSPDVSTAAPLAVCLCLSLSISCYLSVFCCLLLSFAVSFCLLLSPFVFYCLYYILIDFLLSPLISFCLLLSSFVSLSPSSGVCVLYILSLFRLSVSFSLFVSGGVRL